MKTKKIKIKVQTSEETLDRFVNDGELIASGGKLLDRAQANVHKDVHYLARLGILDLKRIKIPGKKTETVQPRCRWSGFDIDLAS